MKIMRWTIMQSAVILAVLAGYVFDIEGARNLFAAYVVVLLFSSILLIVVPGMVDKCLTTTAVKRPRKANGIIIAVISLVIAWHGAFFTLAAFLLAHMLYFIFNAAVEKRLEELGVTK